MLPPTGEMIVVCYRDDVMGVERGEGIDQDGFIVSGADVEAIPAVYRPMLTSCVSALAAAVEGLIAVYLYGGVATGRARPPESDVDLLVVTQHAAASEAIDGVARRLSGEYRDLARDVGIAHVTVDGLNADDVGALGDRCFVKHYCVLLHGEDIRRQLPSYRPSATMAWAFNHNAMAAIEQARRQLQLAGNSDDVEKVCRTAARKALYTAASLTTIITSAWTTDRRRAADCIAEHYPPWAGQAATALEWGSRPSHDPAAVQAFLDGFATWVAHELHAKAVAEED